jgi:hypothetical protein
MLFLVFTQMAFIAQGHTFSGFYSCLSQLQNQVCLGGNHSLAKCEDSCINCIIRRLKLSPPPAILFITVVLSYVNALSASSRLTPTPPSSVSVASLCLCSVLFLPIVYLISLWFVFFCKIPLRYVFSRLYREISHIQRTQCFICHGLAEPNVVPSPEDVCLGCNIKIHLDFCRIPFKVLTMQTHLGFFYLTINIRYPLT